MEDAHFLLQKTKNVHDVRETKCVHSVASRLRRDAKPKKGWPGSKSTQGSGVGGSSKNLMMFGGLLMTF